MAYFYERNREDNLNIHFSRSKGHDYPAHFHQNLEIYLVRDGAYTIEINGTANKLKSGMLAVIDSYDVHAYYDGSFGADDCAIVIPYRYLDRFNRERGNRTFKDNVICNPRLVDELLLVIDKYIIGGETEGVRDAGIALLLSLLLPELKMVDRSERADANLIRDILHYIHNNFTGEVKRGEIASTLGYTSAHISRTFHKYMNRGISDYISALRLEYIDKRRKEGVKVSLTELVYESGFGSMESYYRSRRKNRK